MAVAAGRPDGGRLRLVLVVVLTLALAALVAYGVMLAPRWKHEDNKDNERAAVLASARLEAVNLTTIDYKSADAAVQRILAVATGELKRQFEAQRSQLGPLLSGTRSVSTGDILEAGLVKLEGTTAQALVAVDAKVTTQPAGAKQTQTAVKHYRMAMTLQQTGGKWLVSDVGFTGLAQ